MLHFQPHPGPQTLFMRYDGYYCLYAGAAGPGKTELLRWYPWMQIAGEQERIQRGEIKFSVGRSIIFRRTYPELRELIDRCHRDFRQIDPGADWNQNDKTWTMSCGYKYMFGAMENDGDWAKYYGFEFTFIGFDELTMFTEEQFDQLDTRLRCKDPVLHAQRCIRAGTNPVGIGLEWVRRRFVEIAPPGHPVKIQIPVDIKQPDGTVKHVVEERTQLYIPAKLEDNPTIDYASYAATLTNKSSATKRQLLDGDWYVSSGSCFGELWDQKLHVCKPFKIPPGWTKFRSGDYGYSYPGMSSILWWTVDTDGDLICYRSMTVHSLNPYQLGQAIKQREMEADEWDMHRDCSKLIGVLDSSCWSQDGRPAIVTDMLNMGVHWEKCTKSPEHAAAQFRTRLARRKRHPTTKELLPGIRFFENCWNYVRGPKGKKIKVGPIITIPVLPASDVNPDVWESKNSSDHDMDAVGYACLHWPAIPDSDFAKEELHTYDDDDAYAARKRSGNSSNNAWGSAGYWS